MLFLVYILFMPFYFTEAEISQNLCRPDLCPAKTVTLGCIEEKTISAACGHDSRIIHVNGMLRQSILKNVNILRNFVASGLGNLSIASHMPTMQWDNHLEHLAAVVLRQCDRGVRYCANTESYHYVATVQMDSVKKTHHSLLNHVIRKVLPVWFRDVLGCRMDDDQRIQPIAKGKCVGHFRPLIEDQGDHMGCAIRTQAIPNNKTDSLSMICHLSRANVNELKPYEVGSMPGEGCTTGNSRHYKFLCRRSHEVDHNFVNRYEIVAE